jgi:DNA mismatch endonuclease (patch repair protein)
MSRIRARNTGPELQLRRTLYKTGVRGYRLSYDLLGRPDLVFVSKKIAVFIDGCFWHKCPVHFVRPETRTEFWMKKIDVTDSAGWVKARLEDMKRTKAKRHIGGRSEDP